MWHAQMDFTKNAQQNNPRASLYFKTIMFKAYVSLVLVHNLSNGRSHY
ncbi:MAG: hypothetical protein U5N85_02090 [Arcicella sp.]|nr:hypothetical protein [Arcicella sp.]